MSPRSNTTFTHFKFTVALALLCCGLTALALSSKVLSFSALAENNDAKAQSDAPDKRAQTRRSRKNRENKRTADSDSLSVASVGNGDIVYGRGYGGFSRIVRKDLTQTPGETELSCCTDTEPDWSPDGSKIVYASGRDRGDNSFDRELYIMNADGTNQRRLTFTSSPFSRNENPKFSPDGTRIVYTFYDGSSDNEIKILNLAGLTISSVTDNEEYEYTPDWSPDGSRIIFTRESNIYTIDTDGMNETLVLDDPYEYIESPSFSPNGQKIVFSMSTNNGSNIFVADADGTNIQAISSSAELAYDGDPSWSPDGTKVVFASIGNVLQGIRKGEKFREIANKKIEKDAAGKGVNRIFTVNADGTNVTEITRSDDAFDFFNSPSWQPICGGAIISNGLVSWWRGESNADDSAGTNNGAAMGNTTYSAGKIGQAFDFDGSGDFVEIPDNDSLDVQPGDYTLAAWVNIRSVNNDVHYIAGKGASSASAFYIAVNGQNHPYFQLWTADGSQGFIGESAEAISLNEWHHVLMRKQGGDFKLFVDGEEKASIGPGNFFGGNTAPFTIGKGDGATSPQFSTNGLVDEVLLYNRALSDAEITTLYTGNNPPCASQQQIRLKFNGINSVSAGRQASMTVYLPDFAPAGGATVNLSVVGEAGVITIPSSVFIPEGSNETTFTINTAVTNQNKSVDIVATYQTITGRATVSIHPAVADLTVSNFNAPAEVEIRQNFTASWTTTNVGQAVTNNNDWSDCVFISPDNEYNNGNDTNVGCFYHSATLDVNESRPVSLNSVNIPGSAIPADGDYFLFVFTNSSLRVNEREQFYINNFVSRPIRVLRRLPDYQAINVTAPAEIEPNTQFQVSWTTRNNGSRAATADTLNRVYFSLDNIEGNSDDLYLTQTVTPPLGIGENHDNTVSVYIQTLPVRPSSDAFIYVKVDAVNAIYESENNQPAEQNNTTFRPVRFEYRVPDLQVQSITPPAEVETDTEFALQWTTRNNGNKNAGAFQDVVFFSTDNQEGGNDPVIGTFPLNGLDANTSVNRIQNVTIPTSAITATGNYFVYVKTDYYGNVDEGENENNNVRFQPIRVRRFLRPDLQVTNVTAPNTAFFDQTISVQWTVTNNGPGATNVNQWTDGVYLSTSQNPGGPSLSPTNVNSLNVGESYITSANFRIPRGFSGSYYIVVRTDNGNQVSEENENNNVLTRPITINVPPVPDLRVSNVQAPEQGFAGQPISVSWRVDNLGTGGTVNENSWSDQVWISQDATLNFGQDRHIGTRAYNGGLNQNASYQVNGFTATLPNDIIGNYYVFVVTDAYDQVYEFTSENNNHDYDRVQPGSPMNVIATPPDLIIQTPLTAPATANANQVISVAFTVKNQGAFDATGLWYEGVYLSNDQTLSDDDTLLGWSPRNGLAAGAQYNAAFDVRLPSCISGNFYLIAKTDFNHRIFEFDPNVNAEQNNTSQARAIQINQSFADLRVSVVTTGATTVTGGQPLQVNWAVANNGTAATTGNGWIDRVYLGASPGALQFFVGAFAHTGNLEIGASYAQSQAITVPNTLQGNYFVTVVTDYDNAIPECSAEGNNAASSAAVNVLNSLPDLRITNISSVPTAVLGSSVNVQWTGQNFGQPMTQQQSWIDRVYLSNDDTFQDYDTPLGGAIHAAALGTNASYPKSAQVTMPNVQPGNYFLIVYADAGGNVAEGLPDSPPEMNNWIATPITLTVPGVDLQASNVSAATTVYSGLSTDVSWTVTNAGSSATLSNYWSDYVVLSRDSVFDPADRIIGYRQHNGVLNGGASYNETLSVFIPGGLTGEYSIFVFTDYGNSVTENSEANNLSSPRVADLQLPPPSDLNITNITPPANAAPGENATFTWTVQNSGANTVNGLWTDTVYLSTDTTWDVSDAIVGQQTHLGPVDPATTYTASLTAPVPPIDTGNYYVIVRTDARNTVRESNEINNLSTSVGTTNVAVQTLTLGVPVNTTLVTNQERFYKYNTPADETLLVTLTGEAGAFNELFTRFGSMVNRSNYEFQGERQREANQENVVPNTQAGTYYSMIRGDYVPSSLPNATEHVQLKAELLPFTVRRVSPTIAGNKGFATLLVEGAKFQPGATAKLVGAGGAEITPQTSEVGESRIAAIFDLNGKVAGAYSVVVRNPNNTTATLTDGFQIVNGGGYRLRGGIVGPSAINHVRTRFVVTAFNDGLNDALNVPILIRVPAAYQFELDRRNFIEFPTADLPPDANPAQIPLYADHDGLRTVMLFAPILRSQSKIEVTFDLTPPPFFADFDIEAKVLPPLAEFGQYLGPGPAGNSLQNGVYGPIALADEASTAWSACWAELFRAIFFTVLNELLPSDCLKAGWVLLASSTDLITSLVLKGATGGISPVGSLAAFDAIGALSSKFVSVAAKLAECADVAIPWLRAVSASLSLFQIGWNFIDCLIQADKLRVTRPASVDPNEKLGPDGYGAERWVPVKQPLLYTIKFENLSTATAPAQRIRIIDQLPPGLDSRTLRLREIGFKQYRIIVPDNRAFYQNRIQLGADLNNLQADISAGLDITNNRVTWTLTAIDPTTNEQPLNPLVGLLPPNNANHEGEGYVTFTIEAKETMPTRTDLANNATIYFDDNEPITTNTTSNLLDADIPTSQVAALPATQNSPTFTISWSGGDAADGSGLNSYEVWAAEDVGNNQGTFVKLIANTTATSAQFNGKYGRTYRFYSVARDNAGNIEAPPDTPDAVTTVLGGAYEGDVAPRPNGSNNGQVTGADLTQIRRFVAGLDTTYQYNEFQRADCAPLSTRGNGALSVADVVQARRFTAGLDPVPESDGPVTSEAKDKVAPKALTAPAPRQARAVSASRGRNSARVAAASVREVRPVRLSRSGNKVVVGVELEAQGDEVAVGFTLNFATTALSNPANIALGSGASGASLTTNTSQANQGRLGIVIDKDPNQPFAAGTRQLVTIEFEVAANAPQTTTISFGNNPVASEVVNGNAEPLPTNFTAAQISLSVPTTPPPPAGSVLITEFRLRGVQGALDEFIELYNNTDSPISVGTADGSNGWAIATSDGVARAVVPAGTTIPARGHYLAANSSGYSLSAVAAPDVTYTADLPDNGGLALFNTSNPASFTADNLLDAVGFSAVTSPLYKEGAGLPGSGISTAAQHSWVRRIKIAGGAGTGLPIDTNVNADDFVLVATDPAQITTATATLGAPGPENLASPIQRNAQIRATLLDPTQGIGGSNNRARNSTPNQAICGGNCPLGTLSIRRTYTNNTGQPVRRLRFRIVDLSTTPEGSNNNGIADLRALSRNGSFTVTRSSDNSVVTVQGLTLEPPSDQPRGGGLNSALAAPTITLETPLSATPPNNNITVEFLLGIVQTGNFRVFVNVEALPQ